MFCSADQKTGNNESLSQTLLECQMTRLVRQMAPIERQMAHIVRIVQLLVHSNDGADAATSGPGWLHQFCGSRDKADDLQRRVYKAVSASLLDPWPSFFTRKFLALGIDGVHRDISREVSCQDFLRVAKRLPTQSKIAVLKTWGNSLAASERFHESVLLHCIVGCSDKDSLQHYLCCDFLWAIVTGCGGAVTEALSLMHAS